MFVVDFVGLVTVFSVLAVGSHVSTMIVETEKRRIDEKGLVPDLLLSKNVNEKLGRYAVVLF